MKNLAERGTRFNWPGAMLLAAAALLLADVRPVSAQPIRTGFSRVVASAASDGSVPEGYKVYSALALALGGRRTITDRVAIELTSSLQSREVSLTDAGGIERNLGSIEVLPVDLLAQWHPVRNRRWDPYLGAGVSTSIVWEKSGELDSSDLTPAIGLALQAGCDIALTSSVWLNLDYRWTQWSTDLEFEGTKRAALSVHPSTLGIGLGVRF